MIFTETGLADAFVIDLEEIRDARGFFARAFCAKEFEAHGLKPVIAQGNLSYNHKKGTMRGMHYQRPPAAETKLVRCTAGAIWDVIVDIRPDSPTYMQHFGVEGGYRHDDPALGIDWPVPVEVISEKDATWPLIGAEPDTETGAAQ
ncbi:MAG: dTDP-4-dehydrorhamnose 3,5-epimerase family protein [Rhodobacteraceae bacterium]|nr:dTDP-4-dehydrorhamnose 3,5-epimerase family protein [Paracoccaceae bacterium]